MATYFKEIIDLGHEYFTDMINLGAHHCAFWPLETFETTRHHSQGKLGMEGKMMLMAEHCGTHIDAPRHFDEHGITVDEIPLATTILPGQLLDFTYRKAREAITIKDCEEAERKTGKRLGPGTAVIAWTGVDKDWQKPGFLTERPFVPADTAQWLVDRKITLFATDLIWMDDPDEPFYPTHDIWLKNGLCMVQQCCNLDRLAGKEFLFVCLPLKMRGGTASPVRPVALVM
jgi:kynurenine formamidase